MLAPAIMPVTPLKSTPKTAAKFVISPGTVVEPRVGGSEVSKGIIRKQDL
jgi:hypothetical protein